MTTLTPSQITLVAARLERAGFIEAAKWLLAQKWGVDDKGWETLFRVHHGSLPPYPASRPVVYTPAPRPDQPTAL